MTATPINPKAALALAKSRAYQDAADAPATVRAYASDVARFKTWCAHAGFAAFPAEPQVIGAYLGQAGLGYAYATLRRWVAAIARASALVGAPLDTKHPAIRETLRGIGRTHNARGRRAAALTTREIRQLTEVCGEDLAGLRDRALLLIGFAGAFRRSELAAIDVEHVTWIPEGLVVLVARSKTDGEGQGAEISIVAGRHPQTCPMRALQAWLAAAAIATGPVFRKVARGGHVQPGRLSAAGVWQIVKARTRAAGLAAPSGEYLSPHSLRAGFVTSAYAANVPDEEIMGQTRHQSLATMRGYVRRAKLGRGSPSGKIGL
jgi:integrase